jgi:hypothetical protein
VTSPTCDHDPLGTLTSGVGGVCCSTNVTRINGECEHMLCGNMCDAGVEQAYAGGERGGDDCLEVAPVRSVSTGDDCTCGEGSTYAGEHVIQGG